MSSVQAGNSTEALKAARKQTSLDLLITDISLPGTNGCELAKLLLKRYRDLRILFVSGYVGSEVCRYYGVPTTDLFFLRKPFSNSELAARVSRVFETDERVRLEPANGDAEQRQNSI
jgi:CheY-like chemotaxis protein